MKIDDSWKLPVHGRDVTHHSPGDDAARSDLFEHIWVAPYFPHLTAPSRQSIRRRDVENVEGDGEPFVMPALRLKLVGYLPLAGSPNASMFVGAPATGLGVTVNPGLS